MRNPVSINDCWLFRIERPFSSLGDPSRKNADAAPHFSISGRITTQITRKFRKAEETPMRLVVNKAY
jgi:hypothetical protein